MDPLKSEALALFPKLKSLKDTLHRSPELSFCEHKTTALLKQELALLDLQLVDTGMETGVVAVLDGKKGGPMVALRADIDAIAEHEPLSNAVCSQNDGTMHACGHDFHTACLFGAAALLAKQSETLSGRVAFLFQPAEEITQGASAMLSHGLWERLGGKPACLFGLHNRPELLCGQIAVMDGSVMSGKTNFTVTFFGKAGHGGSPHKCIDPIVAGAALINGIQTIVSRSTNPLDALVCAVYSVRTDAPDFFVPTSLTLTGSIRFHREEAGENAAARLKAMAESTAAAYGCTVEISLIPQVPITKNAPSLFPVARNAAAKTVGETSVVTPLPDMGSEDFAVFGVEVPSFFYWLGSGFPEQKNAAWHSREFVTNDDALPLGAELLARSALEVLNDVS